MGKKKEYKLLLNKNTHFSIIEEYKQLRTNMMFAMPGEGCKIILLTSAYPGEGKTTTVSNLAITFAQTGSRVLIIDCELRKPKIHKMFRSLQQEGLSDVLAGFCKLDRTIQSTGWQNIKVLPAGTIPPNPAELLGSVWMKELLDKLSKYNDYILLDTPPTNIVTDAVVLSPLATGVVLVTKYNNTKEQDIKEAVSKLKVAGANISGVIINKVKRPKGLAKKFNKDYKKYSYKEYE